MTKWRALMLTLLFCTLFLIMPVSAQTDAPTSCQVGFHIFQSDLLATEPVCIPDQPQRIAAVDTFTLESLLALGIKPVSGPFLDTFLHDHAEYTDLLAGITEIGWPVNPEALVEAHPDLIISIQPWIKNIYSDVAKIAPTVSINYPGDGQWADIVRTVGAAINQQDAMDAAFAAYDARLTTFRDLTAKNPVGDVTVVFLLPDSIALFLTNTFGGSITAEAGLKFPQSLVDAAAGGDLTDISKERLDLLQSSDHIFVVTSGFSDEDRTAYQQLIATLEADPLWQSLPAVKAGHVHVVGRDWLGSSLIAANSVLDDLFTHVAGVDPATISPDPFLSDVAQVTSEATAQSSEATPSATAPATVSS